jgi:hypothetical protein
LDFDITAESFLFWQAQNLYVFARYFNFNDQ